MIRNLENGRLVIRVSRSRKGNVNQEEESIVVRSTAVLRVEEIRSGAVAMGNPAIQIPLVRLDTIGDLDPAQALVDRKIKSATIGDRESSLQPKPLFRMRLPTIGDQDRVRLRKRSVATRGLARILLEAITEIRLVIRDQGLDRMDRVEALVDALRRMI